jgi:hypothetical protein
VQTRSKEWSPEGRPSISVSGPGKKPNRSLTPCSTIGARSQALVSVSNWRSVKAAHGSAFYVLFAEGITPPLCWVGFFLAALRQRYGSDGSQCDAVLLSPGRIICALPSCVMLSLPFGEVLVDFMILTN